MGRVSLDSWAELLQTYRQSSAGLRYAFLWTCGRSYFGLMGGASSVAWMDFDFTDASFSFPAHSSAPLLLLLLPSVLVGAAAASVCHPGGRRYRGGAGPSDLLFPVPSATLERGFLLRPYQLCRSDVSDVDEAVRIPAGNGARHSWLASQGFPASRGKTNTAWNSSWNSSSFLTPSAGFRPELRSTGPDRTLPGKKTEEKRGKGVINIQRIQCLSPDQVLDLPEVS